MLSPAHTLYLARCALADALDAAAASGGLCSLCAPYLIAATAQGWPLPSKRERLLYRRHSIAGERLLERQRNGREKLTLLYMFAIADVCWRDDLDQHVADYLAEHGDLVPLRLPQMMADLRNTVDRQPPRIFNADSTGHALLAQIPVQRLEVQ